MIAVDTNVLVRYFVCDEPAQTARAKRFIDRELSEENPGFVTMVTLVELDWVCQRAYGIAVPEVLAAIRKLLEARQIVMEGAEIVDDAMGSVNGDLADALIHAAGRAAGCSHTVTFDRRFARIDGVKLLEAR